MSALLPTTASEPPTCSSAPFAILVSGQLERWIYPLSFSKLPRGRLTDLVQTSACTPAVDVFAVFSVLPADERRAPGALRVSHGPSALPLNGDTMLAPQQAERHLLSVGARSANISLLSRRELDARLERVASVVARRSSRFCGRTAT